MKKICRNISYCGIILAVDCLIGFFVCLNTLEDSKPSSACGIGFAIFLGVGFITPCIAGMIDLYHKGYDYDNEEDAD